MAAHRADHVGPSRRPRRPLVAGLVLGTWASAALAPPVGATSAADRPVALDQLPPPTRVVVGLDDGAVAPADWTQVAPATYVVDVEGSAVRAAAALDGAPGVRFAEPDAWVQAADEPDDPRRDQQAHLRAVRAEEAWDVTHGDPGVVVAVLDTQVDATHPDLAGKLVGGVDFVTGTCRSGTGSAAHGTVVAGLVGAATDNGTGVAGLGWDTKVLPLRVLCDNGIGSVADVAAAVRYATDQGADVINLSLTGPTPAQVVDEAVAYAQARGVILVAAAGNASSTTPVYPAALPGVLSVGASQGGQLASFSNRGTWVDLAAPGVDLFSTVPGGGYGGGWSGTSFAAPLVAATVALLESVQPDLPVAGVIDRLARSAQPMPGLGQDLQWGRLDTAATVAGGFTGLWVAGADGAVVPTGDAAAFGDLTGTTLTRPLVGLAATPTARGYWLAGRDGGVFAFGDAPFLGSLGGAAINQPVVGVAATPTGRGYWLVAADGGVFAFGDAPFLGSLGGAAINQPVVGVAATPTGRGYWLVAADGGVFAFGDAPFVGSLAAAPLSRPVVGMASSSTGQGAWLLGADGGVFALGDAPFRGVELLEPATPAVAVVPTLGGAGYWVVASDGAVRGFGAPFVHRPVVASGARVIAAG